MPFWTLPYYYFAEILLSGCQIVSVENKRKTFRCPLDPKPIATIHRKKGRSLIESKVKVCDESAGGFGLEFDEMPHIEIDENIVLAFDGSDSVCKVMYCRESSDGIFRVGLSVLEEIGDSPDSRISLPDTKSEYFKGMSVSLPMVLAVLVLFAAVGGILYFESTKTYLDEYGRTYSGTPKTAWDNFYQSVVGGKKLHKSTSKRSST